MTAEDVIRVIVVAAIGTAITVVSWIVTDWVFHGRVKR